jgi:hypothetical protein
MRCYRLRTQGKPISNLRIRIEKEQDWPLRTIFKTEHFEDLATGAKKALYYQIERGSSEHRANLVPVKPSGILLQL